MGDQYNQSNDPQTGNSTSAQNAGNQDSGQLEQQGERAEGGFDRQQGQSGAGYGDQGQQGQGGMANDDESRGGPPTGEQIGDDTGGLTSDEGSRTGGGMQQDAMGAAEGSEMEEDEDSDTLQGQTSSGAV